MTLNAAENGWDDWCEEYNKKLDHAKQLPEQERISILQEVVLIGPREPKERRLVGNRLAIFLRAKAEMMAIPGHAEYFDKRIREPYEEFKGAPTERYTNAGGRYLEELNYGLKTLAQLPSPETVKVLGGLLSDEWEAPPGKRYGNYTLSSLATHGVITFDALPLVEPPRILGYDKLTSKERIPIWQKWYAEVKSGERPLAFKGEPRQYRFKPDGTWDTIPISLPPSEEIPKEVVSNQEIAQPPKSVSQPLAPSESRIWIWITGMMLSLMGLLCWKVWKKGRA